MLGVKPADVRQIEPHDPDQLKAALTMGPVAVGVDADSQAFRNYGGGIINSYSCQTKVGHAVLAVGYGYNPFTKDYVIIKNSWGTTWGEEGFGRIALDQFFDMKGYCGVLTEGYFATVKNPVKVSGS